MKSSDYWAIRQVENYKKGEKTIKSFYDELENTFKQAKREIETVVNDFYVRYSENNKISLFDAKKLINKQEIKDLNYFINRSMNSIGKKDKKLINISLKTRITRYEALEIQINVILNNLYDNEYRAKGEEKLKDVYKSSYNRTWYNIDIYNGFHKEFAQIPVRDIEALITYPFNGASFSERIWKQKNHMISGLKESITTMLVQGKNPKTLSKDFSIKFNAKEYEAYKLLHTESSFIIEQGTLQAYKEDGVEQYQILATLDTKTSEICQNQDSKIYDVDKAVVGINLNPFHPFCRSTTTPYYEDDEVGTRVARNPLSNKSMEVPSTMSYKEWQKTYVLNK